MRPGLVALLSVAALAACRHGNPRMVRDTSGVVWTWDCAGGDCTGAPVDTALDPSACGSQYSFGYYGKRVFSLCVYDNATSELILNSCRPVACTTSSDCPTIRTVAYSCRNGVCQNTSIAATPVDGADAVSMCVSALPRRLCEEVSTGTSEGTAATATLRADCPSLIDCPSLPASCGTL